MLTFVWPHVRTGGIEVRREQETVAIRQARQPEPSYAMIIVTCDRWQEFVDQVKQGTYDL